MFQNIPPPSRRPRRPRKNLTTRPAPRYNLVMSTKVRDDYLPANPPPTLTDLERRTQTDNASDRVLGLVPLALDVIESQLRTLDPDTKREIAFRVLDEASVTPKARAKSSGFTLGGDGDVVSPLVASALRGAFQGLGEALRVHVAAPPASPTPTPVRDVTPTPATPPPRSRVRPALSKGET